MRLSFPSGRTALAGLAIMLMVASVFAIPAFAAAPTMESSSDVDEGTTIADFNASPDSNHTVEFNNTDAADGALVVWDPDTGDSPSEAQTHLELDNSSDEFETTDSGSDSYQFNITEDQLATVPMEAGENKTVKFSVYNQSDWTADSANVTTLNVTLDNTMERSVMYVGDQQVQNEDYGLEQNDGFDVPVADMTLSIWGSDYTSLDATRDIGGSNTTVHVYLANETAAEDFDSNIGGLDSETWSKSTVTTVDDGHAVRSYAGAVPSDVDNGTTTMTYDSGSPDVLVFDIGEDFDGQSTIDVSTRSDAPLWTWGNTYGLGSLSPMFLGGSVLAGGFVVFSRRRIGA